jgi:hypothetical protein
MSRWFRHYAGMMRDEKLVRVAVRAKQPVERVVWVWGAILESAAEVNDGGRYEFDAGEAAYFLRCDECDVACIIDCLEGAGRLADGMVARWGDRQFSSDTAAERQRRYRERKSGSDVPERDDHHNGDAESDVTPPSRDARVTPQETETEAEKEKPKPTVSSKRGTRWQKGQKVPDEWKAWARANFPSVEPYRLSTEVRKFEDYWPAQPGRAGIKIDWELTWRNWLRNAFPGQETEGAGPPAEDLVVLRPDDDDFKAVQRIRGSPIMVGKNGTATFTKAEVAKARAA